MPTSQTLRNKLFSILEAARPDDRLGRFLEWFIIALILANVTAAIVATVEPIYQRYRAEFWAFELFSVTIFTVEYLCRLWVSAEDPLYARSGALKARLHFAVSPYGLIDLLAILPFYLSLFVPVADLRFLRMFRLLRLLKLVRYSPALGTLWRVLVEERRALAAAFLIMILLLIVASTAIYYVERHVQPEAFGSIPRAMWWAITTLPTVGFGDVVPVTGLGRLIGAMLMVFGLGMFALPIGIIASGFSNEIHRKEFVVTWGMVAGVPLFAGLDTLAISRIATLLRARLVPPDTTVFHRGDPPDGMYFIASGEVEISNQGTEPVRLGESNFFGEIGLLKEAPRMATVRTVSPCRLLMLDSQDFKELMQADAEVRNVIAKAVEERLGSAGDKKA